MAWPSEPLPEELRQRWLRRDQIAQVSNNRVTLGVTRDALLKR
jgi:hypothetical protein